MAIRIQPRDIEVPEDDPFRNDLLGRRESVEVLTYLVGSFEGPCVLAVDAAWGNGKTTFLKIWAQHLRNQGFPVVGFNAWETDFSGDPFVALSTELTEGLREYANKSMSMEKKVGDTKKCAKEVLRRAVPGVIRLATAGILDINPLLEKEVGNALVSYAEERLSSYQEAQESVKKFKDSLQAMADAVSKSFENRPLIVMIDELDRCRPSYAVELLEVAKHLFAVDHIVFVLAVNRSELAHSIKALYGGSFDAQGYLRRFFDVDFRLPAPGRTALIDHLLITTKINDYFEQSQDSNTQTDYELVRKWLLYFFDDPDLSLRSIAQAIHRLGLVFASLRSDQQAFAKMAAVCLIIRTIDEDLYHQFAQGEVSDHNVVAKLFSGPGARALQHEKDGHLFEIAVITAKQEGKQLTEETSGSELLRHYRELVGSDELSKLKILKPLERPPLQPTGSDCSDREHAKTILFSKPFCNMPGFRESVQRVELLSASLIDESVASQKNS